MKPLEIKGARTRLGLKQKYVADQLDMSLDDYRNRERGRVRFTDEQKVKLSAILELTPHQMNDYLYDGVLPIGNFQ